VPVGAGAAVVADGVAAEGVAAAGVVVDGDAGDGDGAAGAQLASTPTASVPAASAPARRDVRRAARGARRMGSILPIPAAVGDERAQIRPIQVATPGLTASCDRRARAVASP
jgi:hypothetical protein